MSLRSKMQILADNANAENATDSDILKAALVETQDKYNQLSAKLTMDMEALKAAVEHSNEQKAIEVQEALKTASEAILGDMRGIIDEYRAEVEKATADLQKARKQKEKESTAENIRIIAGLFVGAVVAFAIGGYIALLLYGYWYDIPEAVGAVGKIDAVNNGIYQLLNR